MLIEWFLNILQELCNVLWWFFEGLREEGGPKGGAA